MAAGGGQTARKTKRNYEVTNSTIPQYSSSSCHLPNSFIDFDSYWSEFAIKLSPAMFRVLIQHPMLCSWQQGIARRVAAVESVRTVFFIAYVHPRLFVDRILMEDIAIKWP